MPPPNEILQKCSHYGVKNDQGGCRLKLFMISHNQKESSCRVKNMQNIFNMKVLFLIIKWCGNKNS